ncbi:hypothetical protein C8Q80DRAFT_234506 [Daedaleopsis nitida]|nr:hypothetical protein C8Q80DRAFT_234506 [Daedaleopsis nitida]
MSAIAAHYQPAPAADRRYGDIAHYDPATFFSYSQPSLEGSYALNSNPAAAASYWDTHDAPAYPTASAPSLPANNYASSPSSPAHAGPSLSAYPSDYSAHRSLSRSTVYPSASASASAISSSSSSRSAYPSSARAYSSLANAAVSPTSSAPAPPRLQNAQWDHSSLYTIDPDAEAPTPPPSSHASTPPIKEEDAESSFVIEVSVPAEQPTASPMPEVPLRATHAPPKMRKMMYSFRLENFAMHDGIRSAATQPGSGGIEVGPLKEEPVELQWQIDLDSSLVPNSPTLSVTPNSTTVSPRAATTTAPSLPPPPATARGPRCPMPRTAARPRLSASTTRPPSRTTRGTRPRPTVPSLTRPRAPRPP